MTMATLDRGRVRGRGPIRARGPIRPRGPIRRRPPTRRLALLAVVGLALLLSGCTSTGVPSVGVTVGDGQAATGGGQFALSLQLLIALTVLSVVPAILLMATSFTRIIVVLSLLRSAIGIPQLPPNQVLLGLALFLTMFIMGPVWSRINSDALQPYLAGTMSADVAVAEGSKPLREFMLRQTSEADLAVFLEMSQGPRPKSVAEVPTEALLPAFVMSELRTAFTMGFLLFVPFLVIPTQIALPFKILLFVLVDGWVLIVQSLVRSFA
jgi:flagellar biosynthetic protein FliP